MCFTGVDDYTRIKLQIQFLSLHFLQSPFITVKTTKQIVAQGEKMMHDSTLFSVYSASMFFVL